MHISIKYELIRPIYIREYTKDLGYANEQQGTDQYINQGQYVAGSGTKHHALKKIISSVSLITIPLKLTI
mgnify:CR=1 FL=1